MMIPYGLIFLILVRGAISVSREKKDEAVPAQVNKKPRVIEYYVNHNRIEDPLHLHYLRKLDLIENRSINDDTIKKAAAAQMAMARKEEGIEPFCTRQEILAARYFLLDNWSYFVMLN